MPVTVSVVVPNYNYAAFLDERLQSILAQTRDDVEVIVVDDGSTDDSRAVIERYRCDRRVRPLLFDTNSGSTYQRWNDGATLATGEFLWFAGADDSCEPGFLETLVPILDRQPRVGMAYTRSTVIDAGGRPTSLTPSHERWNRDFISTAADEVPFWLAQKTIPTASAVVLRRSLFERCGGFDTSLVLAADHLLWLQLLRQADVAYVAQPLNRFRVHDRTVRAASSRHLVVEERYRVFDFLVRAFGVTGAPLEALRERLAKNWAECMVDRPTGDMSRHRAIWRAARRLDPRAGRRLARLVVEDTLGVRIRGPVAIARYGWRRGRDVTDRLRGQRILAHYSTHYRRARRAFATSEGTRATPPSVHGFGVLTVRPDAAKPALTLPPGYQALAARVAAAAGEALSDSARCRFVPQLRTTPVAPRTDQVREVRDRAIITIQMIDPLALEGLPELTEPILDALERDVYGSFLIVDKVYVYRSPISELEPSASWIWHYDNHPREMLKVMVYLTDVTADSAPFEYLREARTSQPVLGAPLAPLHIKSRVSPEAVAGYLGAGHERHQVTGPAGTIVVFDDNVIHRGTLARTAPRDVLVLQVRPSLVRARPRIDPRWTGSFLHQNVNADPFDMAAHLKAQAGAA